MDIMHSVYKYDECLKLECTVDGYILKARFGVCNAQVDDSIFNMDSGPFYAGSASIFQDSHTI
jgi:hypothetical protein